MPSVTAQKACRQHSLSWPPPILRVITEQIAMAYKGKPGSISAIEQTGRIHSSFDDDLNSYAEDVFLSPIRMYEYEDWASDSDDDPEEVEWDAGITDFALFDDDRRRAQESNGRLPTKWNDMLENQTSALERAVARTRAGSNTNQVGWSTMTPEDMPSLTPDSSPELRDDLDIESYHGQNVARPSVPNYLTTVIGERAEKQEKGNADLSESTSTESKSPHSQIKAKRKRERPGLRHSRTMSGQVHAWTPPSRNMYTLGEEPDAERREELRAMSKISSGKEDEGRGRSHLR